MGGGEGEGGNVKSCHLFPQGIQKDPGTHGRKQLLDYFFFLFWRSKMFSTRHVPLHLTNVCLLTVELLFLMHL